MRLRTLYAASAAFWLIDMAALIALQAATAGQGPFLAPVLEMVPPQALQALFLVTASTGVIWVLGQASDRQKARST